MRIALDIEDELLGKLREIAGQRDLSEVVSYALESYLPQLEAIEHLVAMGGSMPDLADIPRRRSEPA